MAFSDFSRAAVCAALLLGLAWGCAAADGDNGALPGSGGGNGIGEAGIDAQQLGPGGSAQNGDGGLRLNPLCGKTPTCVPDEPQACVDYVLPIAPSGDASPSAGGAPSAAGGAHSTAEGGMSGESGEGGAGGVSSSGAGASSAAGEGGASGAAGAVGGNGEAGFGGAPAPVSSFGCQVQRSASSSKVVESVCGVVGQGAANAPCLTSSDCLAGFGCVGDQNAGLCEKYCCQDVDGCDTGTYCAERPMRDATTNQLSKGSTDTSSQLQIPVCVPAENCDLGAPYPCTAGTQCACQSGTACLVVRSDGTTTCAVPGAGKVGDKCPCAWGHVCSAATNQCLELCYTRGAATCSGGGKCQAASELPVGWGVCVGGTPSAG